MAIVRSVRTRGQGNGNLVAESVGFGLGYTAVLIWSGTALVASFTDGEANPYWSAIPQPSDRHHRRHHVRGRHRRPRGQQVPAAQAS